MKSMQKLILLVLLAAISCNKTGTHEHHEEDAPTGNPNQALYEEVMDVHDEVMPKSEEVYSLKKALQEKITQTPNMAADRKKEIEKIIHELDSADHSMMDWMHKFNPLPDSANQEKAREYLENEMQRIKTVRELTMGAIQHAKEEAVKK